MMERSSWWMVWLLCGALLTACGKNPKTEPMAPPAGLQTLETHQQTLPAEQTEPEQTVTVEEQVLYSGNGITITATALEEGVFGPSVSITAVNETQDNVTITTRSLSANGYMLSASGLYCQVAAGKTARDEVNLLSSELQQAGIGTLRELAFVFHISHSDSHETLGESQLITLQTSASGEESRDAEHTGEEIYHREGIRVAFMGLRQDPLWDGTLVFYMENSTDAPVVISGDMVSVDGYMADVSLWTELRPGTKAVDGMYLLDLKDLALADGEGAERVELTLKILGGETWEVWDTSQPIVLTLKKPEE